MPEELVNQSLPTAADIVKASAAKESEDPPEPKSEPEPKTKTTKTVDDDDEPDDPDEKPEEVTPVADDEDVPDPDGDEPEETSFQAPADVIEFLNTSPEGKKHAKRIEDAYKGLAKKDKQLSEKSADVDLLIKNKPQVDYLIDVSSRLQSRETFKEALIEINNEIAKLHGTTVADILGSKVESAIKPPEGDDDDELRSAAKAMGLDYLSDAKVVRKAVAMAKAQTDDAVKAALASLDLNPSELKEAVKVIKEQQSRKESAEWVDRSAAFIINRAAKGDNPFPGITKEMIAKAHEQYPDLPARELVAKLPYVFPLEFKKAGTSPPKKGHEIIQSGTPKGNARVPNKHPGDMTFADIAQSRV